MIDRIKKWYWEDFLSLEEIGKKLGISASTVEAYMKKEGIPRRHRMVKSRSIRVIKEKEIWAYIAGLFDGEGSIQINKDGVRVAIHNTNKKCLEWLKKTVGGSIYKRDARNRVIKSGITYAWWLNRTVDAYLFLIKVLPYLIIKKEQAITAINKCKEIIYPASILEGGVVLIP